jgi:hypothetical protein
VGRVYKIIESRFVPVFCGQDIIVAIRLVPVIRIIERCFDGDLSIWKAFPVDSLGIPVEVMR